ncbi:DNA/RNA endonuclease G (NUC1) [Bacillus pakistanensis]|uniref:DNA/RNA endonuclease G (NUC1) n=1 Tax=Rossellomorea pakistanensis TaxID=992288 RepID=A0ABS2NDE1_9BACI|nr:DNA/RNA non-specific endonuclease [Bacillus pakistanensis]MBM7585888.1 DNA/RNA endonuclease G (NUC1) [Bacillus pakistanensis]
MEKKWKITSSGSASIFKGSGNLDNLVPMNGNLNKGEWKKLEKYMGRCT